MDVITSFFIERNGETIVDDKFIITDGKETVLLTSVDDLPELLKREWLYLICPLYRFDEKGRKCPSIMGIDLQFREGVEVICYDEKGSAEDKSFWVYDNDYLVKVITKYSDNWSKNRFVVPESCFGKLTHSGIRYCVFQQIQLMMDVLVGKRYALDYDYQTHSILISEISGNSA